MLFRSGDVFSTDLLDAWVAHKRQEVAEVNLRPVPQEYVLYYDL